jgi:hypothetical protein
VGVATVEGRLLTTKVEEAGTDAGSPVLTGEVPLGVSAGIRPTVGLLPSTVEVVNLTCGTVTVKLE